MTDETEKRILRRLRGTHKRYKTAESKANQLNEQRNDLIRAAVEAGIKPGTIARELQLTRPRIRQILGLD